MQTSRSGHLLQLALCAGIALQGACQSMKERVPLTPAMVVTALSRQGLEVSADQLQMPPNLSASGTPDLQVNQAELFASQNLRVRLSCAPVGQCQPFLVIVHLKPTSSSLLSLSALTQPSATRTTQTTFDGERLLAGQHATLVMEDAHMRIFMPVIAVDSGTPGAEVRVTSLDRKQNFRAVVDSARAVHKVLP